MIIPCPINTNITSLPTIKSNKTEIINVSSDTFNQDLNDPILEKLLAPVVLESDSFVIPADIQGYLDDITNKITQFETSGCNPTEVITKLRQTIQPFVPSLNSPNPPKSTSPAPLNPPKSKSTSRIPPPTNIKSLSSFQSLDRNLVELDTILHCQTELLNNYRSHGPLGSGNQTVGRYRSLSSSSGTGSTSSRIPNYATVRGNTVHG